MASKWMAQAEAAVSARFLSPACANSAKSANRSTESTDEGAIGTNGTIGTAAEGKENVSPAVLPVEKRAEIAFSCANSAEGAESFLPTAQPETDMSGDGFAERAAIVECGAGVPRAWAEGAARLFVMPAPSGYPAKRWADLQTAAGAFLDRFAVQAAALGWSAADLFGCDPVKPFERIDRAGLLLLLRDDQEIVAITADSATVRTRGTAAIVTYRRRPSTKQTIPIWQVSVP